MAILIYILKTCDVYKDVCCRIKNCNIHLTVYFIPVFYRNDVECREICPNVQESVPRNCNYMKHRQDELSGVQGYSTVHRFYQASWAKWWVQLFVFSCQGKTLERHFHPLQLESFPLLHSLDGLHGSHVISYVITFLQYLLCGKHNQCAGTRRMRRRSL
jgi:hypothetical protein